MYLTHFSFSSCTFSHFQRNGPATSSCTTSTTTRKKRSSSSHHKSSATQPNTLLSNNGKFEDSNYTSVQSRRSKKHNSPNSPPSNNEETLTNNGNSLLHSLSYNSLVDLESVFNQPQYVSFRNRLHLYGYVNRQQSYNYDDTHLLVLRSSTVGSNVSSKLSRKSTDSLVPKPPKQRKPIYESGEEILYPIFPISEADSEEASKCSAEILEASLYYKEPVEPIIIEDVKIPYKLESLKGALKTDDNEALIEALMSVQETQVEYAFEYDEDDDDIEDEQKKRQRLVQILCLGAIGLGIVTVSSIYVAFYLNQINHNQ